MIRSSTNEDLTEIKALLDASFVSSTFESLLVDCIFNSEEEFYCWLEKEDSKLIACILSTQAKDEETTIGYHLAPVAVHPEYQHQGFGTKIIQKTLEEAPVVNSPVFVLGDPLFYQRFGFTSLENPICPYDPKNQHFRALRWESTTRPFTVRYSRAFTDAEQDSGNDA